MLNLFQHPTPGLPCNYLGETATQIASSAIGRAAGWILKQVQDDAGFNGD